MSIQKPPQSPLCRERGEAQPVQGQDLSAVIVNNKPDAPSSIVRAVEHLILLRAGPVSMDAIKFDINTLISGIAESYRSALWAMLRKSTLKDLYRG